MKITVAAVLITLSLIVGLIFSVLAFVSGYVSDTVSMKSVVGDGIMLISVLFTTILSVQIAIIWILASQIEKLVAYLSEKSEHIEKLNKSVATMKEDLELLL